MERSCGVLWTTALPEFLTNSQNQLPATYVIHLGCFSPIRPPNDQSQMTADRVEAPS